MKKKQNNNIKKPSLCNQLLDAIKVNDIQSYLELCQNHIQNQPTYTAIVDLYSKIENELKNRKEISIYVKTTYLRILDKACLNVFKEKKMLISCDFIENVLRRYSELIIFFLENEYNLHSLSLLKDVCTIYNSIKSKELMIDVDNNNHSIVMLFETVVEVTYKQINEYIDENILFLNTGMKVLHLNETSISYFEQILETCKQLLIEKTTRYSINFEENTCKTLEKKLNDIKIRIRNIDLEEYFKNIKNEIDKFKEKSKENNTNNKEEIIENNNLSIDIVEKFRNILNEIRISTKYLGQSFSKHNNPTIKSNIIRSYAGYFFYCIKNAIGLLQSTITESVLLPKSSNDIVNLLNTNKVVLEVTTYYEEIINAMGKLFKSSQLESLSMDYLPSHSYLINKLKFITIPDKIVSKEFDFDLKKIKSNNSKPSKNSKKGNDQKKKQPLVLDDKNKLTTNVTKTSSEKTNKNSKISENKKNKSNIKTKHDSNKFSLLKIRKEKLPVVKPKPKVIKNAPRTLSKQYQTNYAGISRSRGVICKKSNPGFIFPWYFSYVTPVEHVNEIYSQFIFAVTNPPAYILALHAFFKQNNIELFITGGFNRDRAIQLNEKDIDCVCFINQEQNIDKILYYLKRANKSNLSTNFNEFTIDCEDFKFSFRKSIHVNTLITVGIEDKQNKNFKLVDINFSTLGNKIINNDFTINNTIGIIKEGYVYVYADNTIVLDHIRKKQLVPIYQHNPGFFKYKNCKNIVDANKNLRALKFILLSGYNVNDQYVQDIQSEIKHLKKNDELSYNKWAKECKEISLRKNYTRSLLNAANFYNLLSCLEDFCLLDIYFPTYNKISSSLSFDPVLNESIDFNSKIINFCTLPKEKFVCIEMFNDCCETFNLTENEKIDIRNKIEIQFGLIRPYRVQYPNSTNSPEQRSLNYYSKN